MAEIIKLTCPACGGKLDITEDIERFACSYCGNEHMVIRRGGIVSLKPVVQELERVRVGTDRTASELALVRLEKEIREAKGRLATLQSPQAVMGCFAVVALMTFALSFCMIGEEQDYTCVTMSAFLLGGCLVAWYLVERPKRKERQEIELLIKAKEEEYRRHQRIVQE